MTRAIPPIAAKSCLRSFRQACVVLAGVFLAMLAALPHPARASLNFTEATGRAVIQEGADTSEARMMALEDALYLAALQGGAKIDGFSTVSTDTSLNDFLLVRPASMIMDYTIIDEIEDSTHYSVTIRAVIGEKETAGCVRPVVNATLYKPVVKISAKAPGWASAYSPAIARMIVKSLTEHEKMDLMNASNRPFSAASLSNTNDAFDYAALTGGIVRVSDGDFALVPEIRMDHERTGSGLLRREFVILTVTLNGYHGRSYEPAFSETAQVRIPVRRSTPLTVIDQLSKKTRDELNAAMTLPVPTVIDAAVSAMSCQPLKARLVINNKTLSVPFGRKQGLNENSLAVTSSGDMNWTVLRVSALDETSASLVPLDPGRDVAKLAGKTVEFMELSR